MLALNQQFDQIFFLPALRRYRWLPKEVRTGVHIFLRNLALPSVFVNDTLQAKPARAGRTVVRFVINSSVGLGGLFDPATRMVVPYHGEDFGQTLSAWGFVEGPYLMLPLLGPSNPRDTLGLAVDTFGIDPTNHIHCKQYFWWAAGRQYLNVLDLRSQTFETLQGIKRSSWIITPRYGTFTVRRALTRFGTARPRQLRICPISEKNRALPALKLPRKTEILLYYPREISL